MTYDTPSSFDLKRAGIAVSAFFFLAILTSSWAVAETGEPISTIFGMAKVVDGDTLEISGERVRLEGIDAPESGQTCGSASGAEWKCGLASAQALLRLTGGKDVACDSRGRDKYGRMLGICFADGIELNAELVRLGLAWAFVKYSQSYVTAEAEAKATKSGIWQGSAMPAWDYRHQGWKAAETAAPQGCAIKGNVSGKGRIFHMPWSPWYQRVTVEPARGERWFCSEGEALAAGWRPVAGG